MGYHHKHQIAKIKNTILTPIRIQSNSSRVDGDNINMNSTTALNNGIAFINLSNSTHGHITNVHMHIKTYTKYI